MSKFLYFAYGSNMLSERLTAPERCPSATFVSVAYALNYSLEFSKKSKDSSGKATLFSLQGSRQYGVLFEINNEEKKALDKVESVGFGYDRDDKFFVTRADNNIRELATTYLAIKRDPDLKPFDWYLSLVIAGAKQHGLPDALSHQLKSVSYDIDNQENRKTRLEALKALQAEELDDLKQLLEQ